MAGLDVKESAGRVVFQVKVIAGSSRSAVCGVLDGMLKVKVAAAAERGKANDCLIGLLAGKLGVSRKAIEIVRGKTSRLKLLAVAGVTAEDVMNNLGDGR